MGSLEKRHAVVMAGGSGTRFWPLSREMTPKQLLKLTGQESLVAMTVQRAAKIAGPGRVHLLANSHLSSEIRLDLDSVGLGEGVGYIVEPAARNTAPALALAAAVIEEQDPGALIAAMPSDHHIDDSGFSSVIEAAFQVAAIGKIVTIGLKPRYAETGFGYIKAGESIQGSTAFKVQAFVEKPDKATAQSYLKEGGYFWNAGIFVFSAALLLAEMDALCPGTSGAARRTAALLAGGDEEEAAEAFGCAGSDSIDYAVMEKSDKVAVLPAELEWSDVGNLNALAELVKSDQSGNATRGNIIDIGSQDSIIWAADKLVATIGLQDTIVVDTHDATLVCPKDRAQDVRLVVDELKRRSSDEYLEHRTVGRPWGQYTILDKGEGYKIKIIEVAVGASLSYQMHHHRSEHWIVLQGTAKITRDGETFNVHTNESTFIPSSIKHRLENPGKVVLRIIEVQNGQYLAEDDIVRFDDEYGRDTDEA